MPRYAPQMSQADLRQILIDKAIANDYIEDYGELDPAAPDMFRIIHMLFMEELLPEVHNDWSKIDFSTENLDITGEKLTPEGVPYIRLRAGGDWENPLVCMIYFDGKKLRGYVPKDGNTYNYKTKSAFGNDETGDFSQAKKQFGDNVHGDDDDFEVEPDFALIEQDIDKRIRAKGSYTYQQGQVVSKAAIKAQKQAEIEKDQDLSGPLTADMVYAVISLAAGGSYVKFELRSSRRELTIEEGERLVGVPDKLKKTVISDAILWYSPMDCYPMQTLSILEAAGFAKAPDNDLSLYQDARTAVIRL